MDSCKQSTSLDGYHQTAVGARNKASTHAPGGKAAFSRKITAQRGLNLRQLNLVPTTGASDPWKKGRYVLHPWPHIVALVFILRMTFRVQASASAEIAMVLAAQVPIIPSILPLVCSIPKGSGLATIDR